MKKTLQFVLATSFMVATTGKVNAQLSPTWEHTLDGALEWQKVSSSGNYIVSTDKALLGLDQVSGDVLWSNDKLTGYAEEQISEMSGSPLLIAKNESLIRILNPFDGEVLFNSQSTGISNLETQKLLVKSNGLFVSGTSAEGDKAKMIVVDIATGKTRWEIEEDFGRIISVNELNEKSMIITTLFTVYRLNSNSGEVEWKAATSADAEAMGDSPLGAAFKGLAEEMTADMEFKIDYYQNLKKGVFIIAAEQEIPNEGSDGKTTYTYKNTYSPFSIETGERLWDNAVEMDGKLGDLAFYKEGFIALPDDGKRTKINYYSFDSPEGQWGKRGRGTKIKGGVYNHLTYEKGILLISRSGDDSYLDFLKPEKGEMAFDKPLKIDGKLIKTIDSEKGIAYITTEEFNILEIVSGETLLDKSIETNPNLVALEEKTLYVFDAKKENILKVDLDAAMVSEIYSDKLKLDGRENVSKLEMTEGGILLTSDQSVVLIGKEGELKFQSYYPAPRESSLKRALLYAQAARAAYIGATSYMASGVMQAASNEMSEDDAVGGAIVGGVGMAYEELGNQASDFAKKSFQQANARFKATAEARDFIVMLTEKDKTNRLAKISKSTGEVEAMVDLGKEKEPKYAIDEVTGRIFVDDNGKIACYELK